MRETITVEESNSGAHCNACHNRRITAAAAGSRLHNRIERKINVHGLIGSTAGWRDYATVRTRGHHEGGQHPNYVFH